MKQTVSKVIVGVFLLLFLLSMILGITSCNMQKYCQERYPTQISDSVITTIEYVPVHDTLYLGYNEIAFDTVTSIPENILIHHEEKKGRLKASFDIKKGKITFKCAEDSLMQVIESQKKIITTTRKTQSIQPTKEYIDHWYLTPLIWWFFISLVVIIIWVLVKYLKLYTKV